MNRWMSRIVSFASLAGAVALVPAGVALAQQTAASSQPDPRHGHRMGLVGEALALDSLTPAQRTAIEQLVQTRRTAEVPVHQADAQLLTVLAQQVEQASINRQALAPTVQARESAAVAARAVDLDTMQKLHDLLTSAQRGQLVDAAEANGHGRGGPHFGEHLAKVAKELGLTDQQKQQIATNFRAERTAGGDAGPHGDHRGDGKAWLESFRGDAFKASAAGANAQARIDRRADRMEDLLTAAVPVLSPSQRAQLATHLRTRAAHETHS
jgi:Spy/CpxP family protein refolding chaperone